MNEHSLLLQNCGRCAICLEKVQATGTGTYSETIVAHPGGCPADVGCTYTVTQSDSGSGSTWTDGGYGPGVVSVAGGEASTAINFTSNGTVSCSQDCGLPDLCDGFPAAYSQNYTWSITITGSVSESGVCSYNLTAQLSSPDTIIYTETISGLTSEELLSEHEFSTSGTTGDECGGTNPWEATLTVTFAVHA